MELILPIGVPQFQDRGTASEGSIDEATLRPRLCLMKWQGGGAIRPGSAEARRRHRATVSIAASPGHTDSQTGWRIQVEHSHGRSSCRSPPHDPQFIPFKMLVPCVCPGMKEWSQLIRKWINPCEITRLPKVAIGTGQGQVFQFITASMFARDDVLHLQRDERRLVLPLLTILAAIIRPLPDNLPPSRVHRPQAPARARRNLASA